MVKKKKPKTGKVKSKKVKKSVRKTVSKPSSKINHLLEEAFTYHQKGDYLTAERGYKQILQVDPSNANALHLMGVIALERGDDKNAEKYIRSAIARYKKEPMFYKNLGIALRKQGLIAEAIEQFKKVLQSNPGDLSALINYGIALKDTGDLWGAKQCFEDAIKLSPQSAEAYYNLGTIFQSQAKLLEAIHAYETAIKIKPDFKAALSNLLFNLNYHHQLEPSHLSEIHKVLAANLGINGQNKPKISTKDPSSEERILKIGYVSPDFRLHSVAYFFLPIVTYHDRSKVEVYAYGDVNKPDEITGNVADLADQWRNIGKMTDEELFNLIREDEIDILVDLAGHTADNRMSVFSWRAAPIQVSYLGYPNTTGLTSIDYRISDQYADPPGQTEHLFSEQVVRLNNHFLCYRNLIESPSLTPPPVKNKGFLTFGSFNNGLKINSRVITLWSEILRRVKGAQLVLKTKYFRDEKISQEWKEMFAENGVGPDRLLFYGHVESAYDHLALYNSVDIALDTFPYNGTTTTCEALWMGVPVVTLCGNHHAARVSTTILQAVGLRDCITHTETEYCQTAVTLAEHSERLDELRSGLRKMMNESLLMQEEPFVNDLEELYRQMWNNFPASCKS